MCSRGKKNSLLTLYLRRNSSVVRADGLESGTLGGQDVGILPSSPLQVLASPVRYGIQSQSVACAALDVNIFSLEGPERETALIQAVQAALGAECKRITHVRLLQSSLALIEQHDRSAGESSPLVKALEFHALVSPSGVA